MPGFAAAVRRGRDRHQCDLARDRNHKASHGMTPYPCSRVKPLGHVLRPQTNLLTPTIFSPAVSPCLADGADSRGAIKEIQR